ncbi:MAG: hypothetical protein QME77_13520, partial [bacterium]|nr:hypothetical protein [bacterium]
CPSLAVDWSYAYAWQRPTTLTDDSGLFVTFRASCPQHVKACLSRFDACVTYPSRPLPIPCRKCEQHVPDAIDRLDELIGTGRRNAEVVCNARLQMGGTFNCIPPIIVLALGPGMSAHDPRLACAIFLGELLHVAYCDGDTSEPTTEDRQRCLAASSSWCWDGSPVQHFP